MPNPRPKIENLKPFRPMGEQALKGRLFVRVTSEIEQAVKLLDDAPGWLRRVITEAAERELLGIVSEKPGSRPEVSHVLSLIDQLEQTRLTKRQREIVAAIRRRLTGQ
ncbi:MAG: hypothetical protein NZ482_08005 [Gloeomargarita sp. SKYG98]|nr:hypothetical protein [Gloeomargarita sp. SKYG98]